MDIKLIPLLKKTARERLTWLKTLAAQHPFLASPFVFRGKICYFPVSLLIKCPYCQQGIKKRQSINCAFRVTKKHQAGQKNSINQDEEYSCICNFFAPTYASHKPTRLLFLVFFTVMDFGVQ